jgi:methylenetetrahydrofolate dehydrogenase (NADP+)/methenyltetrahydrofolate cyclohydrolase
MTQILDGKTVANHLTESLKQETKTLRSKGIIPTLAIIRAGENPDDLAYERGALSRCEKAGVDTKVITLAENASEAAILQTIKEVNEDAGIHGCLIFRPLPAHINEAKITAALAPEKDVDGITPGAMAKVYSGTGEGYAPCTAEAVMEILKHYNVELSGKKVCIIGRSLVIGRPLAMLMLSEDATVTMCHSKTKNLAKEAREADILVAAAGAANLIDETFISEEAVLIDVGINVGKDGKITGDIPEQAAKKSKAHTPVPGGVGSVTSTILATHTIDAAVKLSLH